MQLFQLLFLDYVLLPPNYLGSLPLDLLQHVSISPVPGSTTPDTVSDAVAQVLTSGSYWLDSR